MANRKRLIRTHSAVSTAVGLLAVLVIIVGAAAGAYIYFQLTPSPAAIIGADVGPYFGPLSLSINAYNVFNQTAVTETSPTYNFYGSGGMALDSATSTDLAGGTSFDSAQTVQLDVEDNGHAFLYLYAGTGHYIDMDAFLAANSRIIDERWIDVTADGKTDIVVELDVSDIADPDPNVTPTLAIKIPAVIYDTSIDLDTPLDIVAIGTSSTSKQIEWKLGGGTNDVAERTGYALSRLYFVTNRTYEDLVSLDRVNFGGAKLYPATGGSVLPSVAFPTDTTVGAYTGWYLPLAGNYRELEFTHIGERPEGEVAYTSIALTVKCTFTSTPQNVTISIRVGLLTPAQAVVTEKADTVILASA